MVHRHRLLDGRLLTEEFTAHWTPEAHRRSCPKCGAAIGELCVAEDGTEAAGSLCHGERVEDERG